MPQPRGWKSWDLTTPSAAMSDRDARTAAFSGAYVDVDKAAPSFSIAPIASPTKPSGGDGVAAFGGYLVHGERDQSLVGQQKWVTYSNLERNVAIVASALMIWTTLGSSGKWSTTPNKRGGKDAQRGADIVTEGLFEAPTSEPWCGVVRKQLLKSFRGFALQEVLTRRRSDGMVVVGDIQNRPQWTIRRWDKPDEKTAWRGVEQWGATGNAYQIPRERLFYSVENTLSPAPDGVGILRLVAEPARVLQLYQQWEGIGFQTDLRGMPYVRAPLNALVEQAQAAGAKTQDEIKAYVQGAVKFATDFLSGHSKTPDQGLLLDSSVYTTADQAQTPSAIYKWAVDVVKASTSSMPEVGTAIGRLMRDIARIMGAEFLMLGGEDSGGAYSMHEDKTAMFGLIVNSKRRDVAADARRDIAARLVALNGLDPETCTPDIVPEPLTTTAVESACRALALLATAGLHPEDEAPAILRSRMDLPPPPDVDPKDWLLPRGAELAREGAPVPVGTMPTSGGKPGAAPTAADPGKPGNPNAAPAATEGAKA